MLQNTQEKKPPHSLKEVAKARFTGVSRNGMMKITIDLDKRVVNRTYDRNAFAQLSPQAARQAIQEATEDAEKQRRAYKSPMKESNSAEITGNQFSHV